MSYNPAKLHEELRDAGLPLISVRVYEGTGYEPVYSQPLTAPELLTEAEILSAHDPIDHSISPEIVVVFAGKTVTFNLVTDPALDSVDIEIYDRNDRANSLVVTTVPLSEGLGVLEVETSLETAGTVMVVTGVTGSSLALVEAYIKVE